MTNKITLFSCVKTKRSVPSQAKDLYRSDYAFKKASKYAELTSDYWYILSAKYKLVSPDQVIPPYEKTLKDMSVGDRRDWAYEVFENLLEYIESDDGVAFFSRDEISRISCSPLRRKGISGVCPNGRITFWRTTVLVKRTD